MCFGSVEYAWDDRTALRAALAELLGHAHGPAMPYPARTEAKQSQVDYTLTEL